MRNYQCLILLQAYNPSLIYVAPAYLSREGFEIVEVASWERKTLEKFMKSLEKNKKIHRVERFYGSFTRSFTLPDNVDESKIDASFKDGMLILTVPKTEETKPKVIDVKIK